MQLGLWGSDGCESDCLGFLGAFWIPRNPNPSSASSCITLVGLHIAPFQFFLIQDSLSHLQIPLSKLVASEQDGARNYWLRCLPTWSTESHINQCMVCPWLALLRADECLQDGWRHIQLRPVIFFLRYLIISWNFSRWKYFFVHLSFVFNSMTLLDVFVRNVAILNFMSHCCLFRILVLIRLYLEYVCVFKEIWMVKH